MPPAPVLQIGGGILKQVSEAYRKLRGTLRFLLGNLADYDPAQHAVPYEALPAVDRWLLAQHAALMAEVAEAYDTYQVGGWWRGGGWRGGGAWGLRHMCSKCWRSQVRCVHNHWLLFGLKMSER